MSFIITKFNGWMHRTIFVGRIRSRKYSLYNISNQNVFAVRTRYNFPGNKITFRMQIHSSEKIVTVKGDNKMDLIKTYILNGDNGTAIELLKQFNFSTKQLFEIGQCAANSGNEAIVEKLLNLLPESVRSAKLIDSDLQQICIEDVKALIDAGIQSENFKTPMIAYYLNHNQQKSAIELANLAIGAINPAIAIPALKNYIKSDLYKNNSHFTTELIQKLQHKCIEEGYDFAGKLLSSVCDKHDKNNHFVLTKQLLMEFERYDVNISSVSARIILNHISAGEMSTEGLNSVVEKLINDKIFQRTEQRPQVKNIEYLHQQLKIVQENGKPTHGILSSLLFKLIQSRQFEQAIKIKNECDRVQVDVTDSMLSTLLSLWIETNDENKALDVWNTLQTRHPNFKIMAYNIVKLAKLLLSKDRLTDAKLVMDSLEQRDHEIISASQIRYLLKAACEYSFKNKEERNISEHFLNSLLAKGHCDYLDEFTGMVIHEYLDKKQINRAVAAFEYYVNEDKQRRTPRSGRLLTHLIKSMDSEDVAMFGVSKEKASEYIDRVIDLIKSIHGLESANAQIILAFAGAGNKQQLHRILTNPLVEFNSDIILDTLVSFKGKARIDTAVMIGRCTRELNHTSLSEKNLYEFVLNGYVPTDDYTMALKLYNEIRKDKDSVISERFCEILAELLVKNNRPLPYHLKKYCK